ncbi:O-antigen ligase family protein [Caulobacter sp. RL271]|uniref:O-antigen ligase family protein n=1 Tax=Caulobacter segnis TaxID=88688 RepID=A0ABY4ZSV4_9CAUL|nr:O-antigen ligase family protein [Caulobacter segnis]USQ95760.1 O-antigen ligase family protein [Caulobacter segnis]
MILVEIIAFGASDVAVAAVFGVFQAAFLLSLLLFCGWARKASGGATSLWPGLMFLALLVAVAWSLTPFGPGGAHPVWRYLGPHGGSITVDRSSLVINILRLLGLACLFVASQIIGASETRRRALIWYLLLALGAFAALAIVNHVGLRARPRLTATLLSPNSAASLMGVGVVFATAFFSQAIQRAGGSLRLDRLGLGASVSLGLAAVFGVGLALTASRGGIFATVVGLAVLLTWQVIAQGRKVRAVAIIGGLAALLVVVGLAMRSADLTAARLENLQGDATVRQMISAAHWEAFKSSPWFGFGLGSFPVVNQMIMTTENLKVLFDVRATHNLYLQWLEEGGIVGSLFMLSWLLVALWRAGGEAMKPGMAGTLARAAIAAALVVLLHGFSDFAAQVPALQALFAVGLGAVTASAPAPRRRDTQVVPPRGAIAFASVVLVVSLLAAIPLVASRFGGDLSAMPTASAEVLATSIEAGLARNAPDAKAKARLEALSRREVAMRPGSGGAWLRKSAVDFQRGDVTAANQALEHSLDVAPLQTSLFVSRTRLAYENWPLLSSEARRQVMYQARIEYGRQNGERRLKALANTIQNPSGRIGLAFLIVAERAARAQDQLP